MLVGQMGFEFLDSDETPAVDVWKAMGDEVIFTAQPASAEELVGMLRALLRTMQLYEAHHFQTLHLRLKGTAWRATLSENNNALEITEPVPSGFTPILVFIAPAPALGFRPVQQ